METLKENHITESYSDTVFRFDNGKQLKSNRKIEIALTIAEICLRYKKSKLKPVGLPMAKSFNGTVAMDLKQ